MQVSAAEHHACGVRAVDGGVVCWGGPYRGSGAAATLPGAGFVQVAAGGSTVCGLRANGTALCVGRSNVDQSAPPAGLRFGQLSCGKVGLALRAGGRADVRRCPRRCPPACLRARLQ